MNPVANSLDRGLDLDPNCLTLISDSFTERFKKKKLKLEMCPWDTDAPAIAKFA